MTDQQLTEMTPLQANAWKEIQVHLANLRAVNYGRFPEDN